MTLISSGVFGGKALLGPDRGPLDTQDRGFKNARIAKRASAFDGKFFMAQRMVEEGFARKLCLRQILQKPTRPIASLGILWHTEGSFSRR